MLGEGAQAEVYRGRIGNESFAVKWYRPEYVRVDPRIWDRLRVAVNSGSPTEQFLWPFDFVSMPRASALGGYIMPLKPPEQISMVDLLRASASRSFRSLCVVGFHLANSFLKLHAAGLCYRDINFGNVFFNPDTGDIRIADTDNVDVNLRSGSIKGTPGSMAPEVAANKVQPNAMSDRFSLAVLLFFIFMLGHPLKGKRELTLPNYPGDPDKSRRLCEDYTSLFVFDPKDDSNRPVPGEHDPLSGPSRPYLSHITAQPVHSRVHFTASTIRRCAGDGKLMAKQTSAIHDAHLLLQKSAGAENSSMWN